jgi:hypothetical protein
MGPVEALTAREIRAGHVHLDFVEPSLARIRPNVPTRDTLRPVTEVYRPEVIDRW